MDATKAKELLDSVPANEFLTTKFTDWKGKCCAVGHLNRLSSSNPNNYDVNNCADRLGKIFDFTRATVNEFLVKKYSVSELINLADVNNDPDVNGYTQSKPKTRVINLLNDMIEAGY